MIWHAIRVLEDAEMAVGSRIGALAWPLVPLEPIDGPRLSTRAVPIFPGYVFLAFAGRPDWLAVRRIKSVVGFLTSRPDGLPYAFRDDEIDNIQLIQARLRAEYREAKQQAALDRRNDKVTRRRRPRPSKRIKSRDDVSALKEALDTMPVSSIGAEAVPEAA